MATLSYVREDDGEGNPFIRKRVRTITLVGGTVRTYVYLHHTAPHNATPSPKPTPHTTHHTLHRTTHHTFRTQHGGFDLFSSLLFSSHTYRAERDCVVVGSPDVQSIINWPLRSRPATSASTAATTSLVGRQRTTTEQESKTAATSAQAIEPWASACASATPDVRFDTYVRPGNSRAMWEAIGAPIAPRPTNPTVIAAGEVMFALISLVITA